MISIFSIKIFFTWNCMHRYFHADGFLLWCMWKKWFVALYVSILSQNTKLWCTVCQKVKNSEIINCALVGCFLKKLSILSTNRNFGQKNRMERLRKTKKTRWISIFEENSSVSSDIKLLKNFQFVGTYQSVQTTVYTYFQSTLQRTLFYGLCWWNKT